MARRPMQQRQSGGTAAYDAPVTTGHRTFSLMSHAARINRRAEQDRAHELNMRYYQSRAAELALGQMEARTQQAQAGTDMANQFLGQWNQYMTDARGMYNRALGAYEQGFDYISGAERQLGNLTDLSDTIMEEYQGFQQEFGPLTQALSEASLEDLGRRRELGAQFMDLARADYTGVAGRAMADVSQQADIARQSEARRLQSMGIDPTSMRSRGVAARMAGGEATGRALAANVARRGEKERVAGMTATGMELFDPNRMARTALDIRRAGSQLLGMSADVASTAAQTRAQTGATMAQMARGMGQMGGEMATAIGSQYGDVAGLMMGLNYGATGQLPQAGAIPGMDANPRNVSGVARGVTYAATPAAGTSSVMQAYNAPRVWDAGYDQHFGRT